MRKLAFKSGIIIITFLFIFTSCSKDENDDTTSTSKTTKEYLTAGYWKVTAMTIDPGVNIGGTVLTDFFVQMPACTQDDLMRFNSDGTITDDEGGTKCDPNDPQTTNDGTWVFNTDNTVVTIDYPDEDAMTVNIITLNDNTFKGSYTSVQDFGSGDLTYTFTVTMALQ